MTRVRTHQGLGSVTNVPSSRRSRQSHIEQRWQVVRMSTPSCAKEGAAFGEFEQGVGKSLGTFQRTWTDGA